jgi:hypothetical protein
MRVLTVRGGWRSLYLLVCGILIEMAEPFFSSSWRILEPYSYPQLPRLDPPARPGRGAHADNTRAAATRLTQ